MPGDKVFNNLLEKDEVLELEQENRKDMWMQEVSKQIFSTDNIEVKTDLTTSQINALAKGHLFAETYGVSLMANLCNRIEVLLVSKDRKGRKEFTEIAKTFNNESELDFKPSLKERLGF
jgi:hypothetical protein